MITNDNSTIISKNYYEWNNNDLSSYIDNTNISCY